MNTQIVVKNSNNIIEATIPIEENKLNIFYGANGTGKSTIAQMIFESSKLAPNYNRFIPYQLSTSATPEIDNCGYSNVSLFNSDYIDQFAYQKDTVLKDSFEVFIRTQKYDQCKQQIDQSLANIRVALAQTEELVTLKSQLDTLLKNLKVNKSGTSLSKSSTGVKSVLQGLGGYFNPPKALSAMKPFFQNGIVVGWAGWRLQGREQFGEKGICPYCAAKDSTRTKRVDEAFCNSFDKASVNLTSNIKAALEELSGFLDPQKVKELLALFGCKEKVDTLEFRLAMLALEAQKLHSKITTLQCFNALQVSRENIGQLSVQLAGMKIDPQMFESFFVGPKAKNAFSVINQKLDAILAQVASLKGEIGKYQTYIEKAVSERKKDINELLETAGFRYRFNIIMQAEGQAKAVLEYVLPDDTSANGEAPSNNLSWGERHAFALVMFMFDAIHRNSDLIILDDPISSFDSNKKYALMHRIFKSRMNGNSFYQKTVLLLTHDFQPVIDYIQVGDRTFDDSFVKAYYCRNTNGVFTIQEIKRNQGVLSTVLLMSQLSKDEHQHVAVRIGCLRKYIEHTVSDPKENSPAYNILSSLIHGRTQITKDSEGTIALSSGEIEAGLTFIKTFIADFEYDTYRELCKPKELIDAYVSEHKNYAKLLVLRAYSERENEARDRLNDFNEVVRKYVDETFHVENDYIYSLDPRIFDTIPLHILKSATSFMEKEGIRHV